MKSFVDAQTEHTTTLFCEMVSKRGGAIYISDILTCKHAMNFM